MKSCKSAMVKKLFILICMFFSGDIFASNCHEYKKDIDVNIKKVEWKTIVKSSENEDMSSIRGFISVQPFHKVNPKTSWVYKGDNFCVFLKSVDIEIGFEDFVITIDKKYKKDSCEYNAVLDHEYHHRDDAINIFNNVFDNIEPILNDIVNKIEPISVETPEEVPVAVEQLVEYVEKNEKLLNLSKKFQEQYNKTSYDLDSQKNEKFIKCIKDKVDAAFDKFYKDIVK